MRPTLSLLAAFRPSRPLFNVTPSTPVPPRPIKKYPQPFKLNRSTPHARHIVRAVLTSPTAHATPFGALSNLELYDEIQRQFSEERLKGEDLVSAMKEEEKEEQAWREHSLWGNELKKGKEKEKSKGDGKGDGSQAGKGKPAPDLRPVSSMRCAFFVMFCVSGELREWMAALWCWVLDIVQIWLEIVLSYGSIPNPRHLEKHLEIVASISSSDTIARQHVAQCGPTLATTVLSPQCLFPTLQPVQHR